MPSQTPSDPTSEPRRRRSWPVQLGVFVAGVLVGVLIVGLLDVGEPAFVTGTTSGQSPAPAPSASVEVAAQARVNAACLRVINEAQDVYGALDGLGPAVDSADLQALDDIVRRLQPVEPRLAEDLRDCRVQVDASGPAPSATPVVPVPTASPSGVTPEPTGPTSASGPPSPGPTPG